METMFVIYFGWELLIHSIIEKGKRVPLQDMRRSDDE
jgi:hypothetical protein